jgi:glycosyltransferase involved in cell wall biosynthesis
MIHYITTNGIGNAWVAAELQIMEQHKGIPCVLHSLRGPHQNFFGSAWADRINRETRLLYPLPKGQFVLSLLLAPLLFGGQFLAALANALFGQREGLRARLAGIAHLLVACHWARLLRKEESDVSLIHAQWIHSSGTVGMYGAWLLGVPFSFTGHAVDLFRDRVALHDKIRRADFIVCISSFHRDYFIKNGADPAKCHIVFCGIDVEQMAFRPRPALSRPRLLSIGRLVEKKGFGPLIEACRLLADRGIEFGCEIAGDGPLEAPLKQQVTRLGLEGKVIVTGKAILQEQLADWFARGSIFAQPCVWSKDNDVDGTPRTLMEAMACGLPSVSTRLVGIPDIIEDGVAGLLVAPESVSELADALERLIRDSALARRLADGGRRQIVAKFRIENCLEPLAALYRAKLRAGGHAPSTRPVGQAAGNVKPGEAA